MKQLQRPPVVVNSPLFDWKHTDHNEVYLSGDDRTQRVPHCRGIGSGREAQATYNINQQDITQNASNEKKVSESLRSANMGYGAT
jgi:hypothetical protein